MIAVLSHRLEGSKLDDLTLSAEVTELLMNLPAFPDLYSVVPHLHGVLDHIDHADRLVEALLPGARNDIVPALGSRFFLAMVDATEGRELPFVAVAPTQCRALLAAAFRAYDHLRSACSSKDGVDGPASMLRAAGAFE